MVCLSFSKNICFYFTQIFSNLKLKKYEIRRLNTGTINGGSSTSNFFTLSCEGYTKISFDAHVYANDGGYLSLHESLGFNDSASYGGYGDPCTDDRVIASNISNGTYEYDIEGCKYIFFKGYNRGQSYSGVELRHIVLS